MGFFKIHTAQAELISASRVDVEIDISNGLYSFNIVGLGDKAINESKDRVSSAIKYSGFKSPKQKNQKVVISLAPADKKKIGACFDIPMAVGYLAACKEINFNPKDKLFIGELSLNGETRKTPGIMQITNYAKQNGFREIYVPYENISEASFISDIDIYPVKNLNELILHLSSEKLITKNINNFLLKQNFTETIDFSEIKGHETAKRALLIAASGKHNIAFYGPPGTGKSMLARSLIGIIPKLNSKQIIETTSIYSFSGFLKKDLIISAPFRAPHHTSSYSAIIGGSTKNIPRKRRYLIFIVP
jgi:magnesium chelatase family protein